MISSKTLLCIGIAFGLYLTNVYATGSDDSKKETVAGADEDDNSDKTIGKAVAAAHEDTDLDEMVDKAIAAADEDTRLDEMAETAEVADEDMNLDKMAEKGRIFKYQYVVIIFCKAMNSELKKEQKPIPDEIDDILRQLESFVPEKKILLGTGDYQKLTDFAKSALQQYASLLVGQPRHYPSRAYYCRLLQWLRFNIRFSKNYTSPVETLINVILAPTLDDTQPKNFLQDLFPLPDAVLQEEYLKIKSLNELEAKDRETDKYLYLFLQLAENDGNIYQIVSDVQQLIPDAEYDLAYCENMRQNFEKLINDFNHNHRAFVEVFKKLPEEILLYVNEAVHVKCKIEYVRAKVEEINLKHVSNPKSAQHIHGVMTMYSQLIEKTLLTKKQDEETIANTLRLENFPIGDKPFEVIEMKALLKLSLLVINQYHTRIVEYYNGSLSDSQIYRYGRLVRWASRQIMRAYQPAVSTAEVIDALKEIRESPEAGYKKGLSLDLLNRTQYDQIDTFDDLINFCNNGKLPISSPPDSQNTEIEGNPNTDDRPEENADDQSKAKKNKLE